MNDTPVVLGVGDFVAVLNQTLDIAFPYIEVVGEVANFRVSKGKWVYFDLKDEAASVKCFATVYALSGPLEDGMVVRVGGSPRLHPLYNFSFNVQNVTPVGEGALKRQADMLRAKLEREGLFDPARKRSLPTIPRHIALITAEQSAACADFIKIARARWGGVVIDLYDVQVQGDPAVPQIVDAIGRVATRVNPPEVVVIIRGGGSADDLAAFSDERVVRAVASSRVPTLVAIGHEIDTSLAELAADVRASTPSNAAELLFPDKNAELRHVTYLEKHLSTALQTLLTTRREQSNEWVKKLDELLWANIRTAKEILAGSARLVDAYDPDHVLRRGYVLAYNSSGDIVTRAADTGAGELISLQFADGKIKAAIQTGADKRTE